MLSPEVIRKIKLFEIRSRKLMTAGFAGEYASVFRGRGMEFDEVRQYAPGDDVRLIDWNVSARTGSLYIKKHIEEREQTVLLAVDLSRSQDFTTSARTKREIAAEVCCILGMAAASNHDRVGLLLFTDRVEYYTPPKSGTRHALRIVRDLMLNRPQSSRTDLSAALSYINRALRRPAVVFLVSDFLSPDFEKELRIVSRRHDVVAIEFTDRLEQHFPSVGLVEVEDAETGERVIVDSSSAAFKLSFNRAIEARQEQLRRLFGSLSIDYVSLNTHEPYEAPLRRLFALRSQRLSY